MRRELNLAFSHTTTKCPRAMDTIVLDVFCLEDEQKPAAVLPLTLEEIEFVAGGECVVNSI